MNLLENALNIIKSSSELDGVNKNYVFDEIFATQYYNYQTFKLVSATGKANEMSELQVVLSVDVPEHGEVLVACDGTYSSWGDDWFGKPYLAKAEQVTVTIYKPI